MHCTRRFSETLGLDVIRTCSAQPDANAVHVSGGWLLSARGGFVGGWMYGELEWNE